MKTETTKAILVINMPNSCDECQFSWNTDEEWKLSCQLEHDLGTRKGNKPEWCPLRPLPEKLFVEANKIEDIMPSEFDMDKWTLKIKLDTDKIFAFGWNKCLEEIENEWGV